MFEKWMSEYIMIQIKWPQGFLLPFTKIPCLPSDLLLSPSNTVVASWMISGQVTKKILCASDSSPVKYR